MRLAGKIALLLLVAGLLGLAFVYSGFYNVAATDPHSAPGYWLLDTVKEQSVRRRAAAVEVPRLDGPEVIRRGFAHYDQLCVPCHGAPGIGPSMVGIGLTPPAPSLINARQRWSSAELFWITKHGIKMTGMPAWHFSQDDADLWAVVAFMEHLPELSAADYRRLMREVRVGLGDAR